jgi:hypothetical protein
MRPFCSFYIGFDRGGHPVYLEYFGATQWLKARPSRAAATCQTRGAGPHAPLRCVAAPQVLQHVSQEDVIRAHVQQMARLRAASRSRAPLTQRAHFALPRAGGDAPPALPRRLRARRAAHPAPGASARMPRGRCAPADVANTLLFRPGDRSTSWTCAA